MSEQLTDALNEILFDFHPLSDQWQMGYAARCTLVLLLRSIRPPCAIEIGTAQGGSLAVLARFATRVYTIDPDSTCRDRHGHLFPNVEFVIGNSQQMLPGILRSLQASDSKLGFILIDGDHRRAAVRQDIDTILQFRPERPLYILMHDSFNPDCRQGMLDVQWAANPYVSASNWILCQGFSPTIGRCGVVLAWRS